MENNYRAIDTRCRICGYRVLVWDKTEKDVGRCRMCGGKREILGSSKKVRK